MMSIQYIDSPIGILELKANEETLLSIAKVQQKGKDNANAICNETAKQLSEYFNHQRKEFNLPLRIEGSAFYCDVLNALRQIPYGSQCSYSELAKGAGHEKACRALGNAIHNNPYPIVIPCHRVIKKDGSMGGFAYGPEVKTVLLNLEKDNASATD